MIKTPIPPNAPMILHIQTQVMRAVVVAGPNSSQSGQIGVHCSLESSQYKFSLHVILHLLLLGVEGGISVRMVIAVLLIKEVLLK